MIRLFSFLINKQILKFTFVITENSQSDGGVI